MKWYALLLVTAIFNGCVDHSKLRTGIYEKDFAPNYYYIVLLKNNRFQYSMFQDIFGDLTVKGTWQKKFDTILLEYDSIPPKFIEGSLQIEYLDRKSVDSIYIQIVDSIGVPIPWIGPLIVDGKEYNTLTEEAKVYIKPRNIDTIRYKYMGNTGPISLGVNKIIDKNIRLTVFPNYERAFIYDMLPDKLIYRKRKLYFSEGGKTDFRYPYKRVGKVKGKK